ncbi:hypothetical protein [Actinomyces denticolens]|nr:hypothetical protein [Actinomyces denticolens]
MTVDRSSSPEPRPGSADGATPGGTSSRGRAIVSIVLAVSLLLGGGVAGYALLGSASSQARAAISLARPPAFSADWLNGAQEVWTYDASEEGDRTRVWGAGDKLVRSIRRSDSTLVTVLRRSGDGVEPLWEQTLGKQASNTAVWKNWVVDGGDLIDLDTQERVRAPWSADATVSAAQGIAIACEGPTCTLWTSRYDERWTTTIPSSNQQLGFDLTSTVGRYVLGTEIPGADLRWDTDPELLVVDLEDGSSASLGTISNDSSWVALSDGWAVAVDDPSGAIESNGGPVALYSLDGTSIGEVREDDSKDYSTFPYSPTPISVDQARAWIESADTSWAPSTMSVPTGSTCPTGLNHGGGTLRLAAANSVVRVDLWNHSTCHPRSAMRYMTMMGTGPLAVVREVIDDQLSLHLVDPDSPRESGPIRIGGGKTWDYFTDGTLLIAFDASGRLTAYRPMPAT